MRRKAEVEKLSKLWTLFRIFFSISSVALGGGLTMLPIMTREFVEKRHWLNDNDMVDTVAVMQSLPGIIGINMAVLLGYRMSGVLGAICSVAGVVLPPTMVILIIAIGLAKLDSSETMSHIFMGVRSAVSALILLSAIKLGKKIVNGWFAATISIVSFIALILFNANAIYIVIAGGLAGIFAAYLPAFFRRNAKEAEK